MFINISLSHVLGEHRLRNISVDLFEKELIKDFDFSNSAIKVITPPDFARSRINNDHNIFVDEDEDTIDILLSASNGGSNGASIKNRAPVEDADIITHPVTPKWEHDKHLKVRSQYNHTK